MSAPEVTVGIAGAAGDGQAATGDALALLAGRLGLHLYIYNSYQSVIRGGHVWLRLRISQNPVESHGDHLHAVLALNQEAIEEHKGELKAGGVLLYNSDKLKAENLPRGVTALPFSIKELTATIGPILPIQQNTVLLGGFAQLAGFPIERLDAALASQFSKKGDKITQQNIAVARAGFEHAQKSFQALSVSGKWQFTNKARPVITGNEAFGMGAAAAGCKFYSAYPMTPASGVLHWFAAHAEQCQVVVKQAEDEIAVANMAIGAGHAGVRSMCATSGGGFALMTEAIGMAAMIEAPVVIINVMRAGPSTGVPTKTEQADLNQVVGASQGDYPRMIVAPYNVTDCFRVMEEAFNVAERYQMPVLVISDLLIGEHNETVEPEAFQFGFKIDRGDVVGPPANGKEYLRYKITENGVSPRAYPGTVGTVYTSGTDEHDEKGILVSDVFTHTPTRRKMVDKRSRKIDALRKELPAPTLDGAADAPITFVGWGSTYGVIREAMARLAERGIAANHLNIRYLHPFHEKEVQAIFGRVKKTLIVENSESGQFARHLRAETGLSPDGLVLKYDGEPFEPMELVAAVEEFQRKGSPAGFRYVCETPAARPFAFRQYA